MKSKKQYYVYIITNKYNTVLYTGVTSDLEARIEQHINKVVPGFSSKYNLNKLVYFEKTEDIMSAIEREKMIKGWTRNKKKALITKMNSKWKDLSEEWIN